VGDQGAEAKRERGFRVKRIESNVREALFTRKASQGRVRKKFFLVVFEYKKTTGARKNLPAQFELKRKNKLGEKTWLEGLSFENRFQRNSGKGRLPKRRGVKTR